MKKRYGLDSIIGKRSKLRFPHHIFVPTVDTLNFILPANLAISEPPLSTALTMKKGDPLEFCDQFNESSYSFEEGFPLNVIIYLSVSELLFEVKSPTTFSLFGIIYNLEDYSIEEFRASKTNVFLSNFNFALAKLSPEEDFFISDIIGNLRSIYGSLMSYNCKRPFPKRPKLKLTNIRKRKYLVNNSLLPTNSKRNLYRIIRAARKAKKISYKEQIEIIIDQIYESFYGTDLWDDLIDLYLEDPEFVLYYDLYEILLSSFKFRSLDMYLDDNSNLSSSHLSFLEIKKLKDENSLENCTDISAENADFNLPLETIIERHQEFTENDEDNQETPDDEENLPDIIDENNENRGDYDHIDHFEDFEDLEYDDFHRNLTELQSW